MRPAQPLIVFICPESENVLAATPHRTIADGILRERFPEAVVQEIAWQGDAEALVWGIK